MHNARLTERASFQGQVDVVPHASDRPLRVWGQDVSETGMFLQTTQPFCAGETVSLRFDVDEAEVHVRAAEVVWVRGPVRVDGKVPGIGLRFLSLDARARSALRRRARPVEEARDTIVDVAPAESRSAGGGPAGQGLPEPRVTLPPLTESILQKARGLFRSRRIRQEAAGADVPTLSLAPFSRPPLAISLPPDQPPSPRAVTLGPAPRERRLEGDDADVDLFVGWTFRPRDKDDEFTDSASRVGQLSTGSSPGGDELAARPEGREFHEPFDDDAPFSLIKSIIEDPSIVESASLPPEDSRETPSLDAGPQRDEFLLGSLPPAVDEGALSIRHLPLVDERRPAPRTQHRLRTAATFILAGSCAGAVVGMLLHERGQTTTTTLSSLPAPVTSAPGAQPEPSLPTLQPLVPPSVDVAEVGLPRAEAPRLALIQTIATDQAPPAATAHKSAPNQPKAASTGAGRAPAATSSGPSVAANNQAIGKTTASSPRARPGHLEVDLPLAGKVKGVFALSSPSRVVIDLEGARLPAATMNIDEGGIVQLRFGHPQPQIQRVVVVVAGDKPQQPRARVAGQRLRVSWGS